MKKEELMYSDLKAPKGPVRFTIDDEKFSFQPLPLGTLAIIDQMKDQLHVNREMLHAAPIAAMAEWMIVTQHQADEIRKIVCLFLEDGHVDIDRVKARLDFLRSHCSIGDVCSLFIIGTLAQRLWLRDAGIENMQADLGGISEDDFWGRPFVELIK